MYFFGLMFLHFKKKAVCKSQATRSIFNQNVTNVKASQEVVIPAEFFQNVLKVFDKYKFLRNEKEIHNNHTIVIALFQRKQHCIYTKSGGKLK